MTRMHLLALSLALACPALPLTAATALQNLQVEYQSRPLGIDVTKPRFSWQMQSAPAERDCYQTAYRIEVSDPRGAVVWDSQRVEGSAALAISYAGQPLRAATRYKWALSVWDEQNRKLTAASWFETGLLDSKPGADGWSNAQWIGGGDSDLVLYSPYLAIFDLSYAVTIAPGSTRAGFVYGANDSRLMDRYKNVEQLANGRDQSYIKLVLDIAEVGASPAGKAKLHVYRVGYKSTDSAATPLRSFDIGQDVINAANRNLEHVVEFRSAFGQITITIDGKPSLSAAASAAPAAPEGGFGRRSAPNSVNLNPAGQGGDYLVYGLLCDIGFAMEPGQSARFGALTVRNNRAPRNVLLREEPATAPYRGLFAGALGTGLSVSQGRFEASGGSSGLFIVRDPSRNSMPMLRTRFTGAAKPVEQARLYATARGIYELYLNGKRVGDSYYTPGLTQYNITHLYQTYDVTELLQSGENALGARLGEGWWSGLLSFGTIWNHFGDRQSLLAKLVITYKDGTSDVVVTDPRTWKYFGGGPLVYSSLDFGEVYDASREAAVEGWNTPRYDDRGWKPASVVNLAGTAFSGAEAGRPGTPATPFNFDRLRLVGQMGPSAGVYRTLSARSVKQVRPGVFVYDLGQNMVGVPRITIADGRAGARLTLRYAEILYPDLKESGPNVGMPMTENYRAAISQDIYTMKAGPQVFQPRFTSHGFQFVELTGIDKPLPLASVEGVVISSLTEVSAGYKTSNAKVNQLWSNLVWSNIDNFLSIPTDCPQRNERMGWSGDINVFSRTATYVSNADPFLTRHMQAMRDVQSAAGRFTDVAPVGGGFGGVLWGSAGIVVPWEAYQQYRDVALLESHYAAMVAYMDYLETTIDAKTGLSSDAQLGDWLGPQNDKLGSAFLATAYHAYDLGIMAQVAQVLGRSADVARFKAAYDKRKALFNATFVNPEGKTIGLVGGRGLFGGGPNAPAPEFKLADTQTSYAVGLAMDLFNDQNRPQMVKNLADAVTRENRDDGGVVRPKYSLMTGFIGTAWISKALSDHGLSELAYRLLLNDQYPSWLYAIDQGATTIWERLNGYTVENGFGGNNSMNSFNHYSFGAVGQWMMAYSLGIQRGEPGFQKFILQPEPDPTGALTSAEGYYDSPHGRIGSAWSLAAGTLTYRASVPANTSATLYLPAAAPESVKEGGKPLSQSKGLRVVRAEKGRTVLELKSGDYEFSSAWK